MDNRLKANRVPTATGKLAKTEICLPNWEFNKISHKTERSCSFSGNKTRITAARAAYVLLKLIGSQCQ